MPLKMLEGMVLTILHSTHTLSHKKRVHQTKKKKSVGQLSPKYYPLGSLLALQNSKLSLSSSPSNPQILLLPLSQGIYILLPLRTESQTSRCIGLLPSPCAQKSNYVPWKWKVWLPRLCPTLYNSMNCSPPGSFAQNSPGKKTGVGCQSLLQEIFLTQGLNWVSCIAGRFFTVWATKEALL